jgi:hypothetical protein
MMDNEFFRHLELRRRQVEYSQESWIPSITHRVEFRRKPGFLSREDETRIEVGDTGIIVDFVDIYLTGTPFPYIKILMDKGGFAYVEDTKAFDRRASPSHFFLLHLDYFDDNGEVSGQ